jgi:hypothetical protein
MHMATAVSLETFHCMMCGHEYQEPVEKGEDKRSAARAASGT